MKQYLSLMVLAICLVMTQDAIAKQMSVQMETGRIRSEPKRFGRIQKTVPYGTRLEVLATSGSWVKVSGDGVTGWIPSNSLTKRKLKALSGQEAAMSKVSGGELATGSKGFTKEIEENYKKKNATISFAWIDKMVNDMKVSFKSCETFLADGGLEVTKEKGGAK